MAKTGLELTKVEEQKLFNYLEQNLRVKVQIEHDYYQSNGTRVTLLLTDPDGKEHNISTDYYT